MVKSISDILELVFDLILVIGGILVITKIDCSICPEGAKCLLCNQTLIIAAGILLIAVAIVHAGFVIKKIKMTRGPSVPESPLMMPSADETLR